MREKISSEGPLWKIVREARQQDYKQAQDQDIFDFKEGEFFKNDIRKLLNKASLDQTFPVSIKQIEERLSALKVVIINPEKTSFMEKWGDFDPKNHIIRLSNSIPEEYRFQVFVHEVFHALSGQVEAHTIDNPDLYPFYSDDEFTYEYINGEYNQLKFGISFQKKYTESGKVTLDLSWLNEALTEHATHMLVGKSYAYKNERKLLDLIIKHGNPQITQNTLYKLYFENYTLQRKGHQLPATKELFLETNKKFGQGFLLKLDKFINSFNKDKIGWSEAGIVRAVECWTKLQDQFPDYILEFDQKSKAEIN